MSLEAAAPTQVSMSAEAAVARTLDAEGWLSALTVVLMAAAVLPYIANYNLFPIKQREPFLALSSFIMLSLTVSGYMLDELYPGNPVLSDIFFSYMGTGFTLACIALRLWSLFFAAGLTNERVTNKHGWFVKHRNLSTRKCIRWSTVVAFVLHLLIVLIDAVTVTDPFASCLDDNDSKKSTTGIVIVCLIYLAAFIVFSWKLSTFHEGFFIKQEFRMIALGDGVVLIGYLIQSTWKTACALPACDQFLIWLCWVWLGVWSIGFPVFLARRDPKFAWCPCSRQWSKAKPKQTSRASTTKTMDSNESHSEELDQDQFLDWEPKEIVTHLPREKMEKLARLPLGRFLTYPPGREAFRNFLVREFSIENLLFLEAVRAFKVSPTKEEAHKLFDQFIAPTAPNQVNLAIVCVRKITEEFEDGADPQNIFDEAYTHVVKLLQRDSYQRFKRTPAWHLHVCVFAEGGEHADDALSSGSDTDDFAIPEPSRSRPSRGHFPAIAVQPPDTYPASAESSPTAFGLPRSHRDRAIELTSFSSASGELLTATAHTKTHSIPSSAPFSTPNSMTRELASFSSDSGEPSAHTKTQKDLPLPPSPPATPDIPSDRDSTQSANSTNNNPSSTSRSEDLPLPPVHSPGTVTIDVA